MNDLLQFINNKSIPILIADYISLLLTQTPLNLIQILIQSLKDINTWFKNSYL